MAKHPITADDQDFHSTKYNGVVGSALERLEHRFALSSLPRSSSCFLHSVIWRGCTSNCSASSESLLSPRIAANATFALNSAPWSLLDAGHRMALCGKQQGTILVDHLRETEPAVHAGHRRPPHFSRQNPVACQRGNMPGELRHVMGRIQETVLAGLYHFGGASDPGQNNRQPHDHRLERRV